MAVVTRCLDRDRVESYLHDHLSARDRESLEMHLADCASCQHTVETYLRDESLYQTLQSAGTNANLQDSPIVGQLIKSVQETLVTACGSDTGVANDFAGHAQTPLSGDPALRFKFLAPAQQVDEIGRLAHLRILKILGEGGMGVVFLAEDTKLERRVAVKVMRPEAATNAEAGARFRREALVQANLPHAHIVAIHEVNEANGVPFIVMEYIDGPTFEDRLRAEPPLSARQTVRILKEIAEALAAAAARGIVHRDLKPSNVLLAGPAGVAKIADFGLARAVEGSDQVTHSGTILGTPAYMAPEQAHGQRADAKSDLFSLGCIITRALADRSPFDGATPLASLGLLVKYDKPKPFFRARPDLPRALGGLVDQLLQKNPAHRPADAQRVAQELERIEQSLPAGGTGPTPAGINWKRWLVAASLLAMLPVAYYFGPAAIRIVTNKGVLVVEADNEAVEVTIKGEEVTIVEKGTKREFTLSAGQDHEVKIRERPDGIVVATKNFRLERNGQFIVDAKMEFKIPQKKEFELTLVTTLPLPNPDDKEARTRSLAFSPDATRLLAATGKTVVLWDVPNRKKLWMVEEQATVIALSPDGTRAFSGGGHISLQIIDAKKGDKIRTLAGRPLHEEVVFDAVFLPDNRQILVSHRDFHLGPTTIRLWDTETGKEVRSFPGHKSYADQLALSADGRRFASSGHLEKVARLWDIDKDKAVRTFEHPYQFNSVALSADGRCLATASTDAIVRVWPLDRVAPPQQLRGHDRDVSYLRFSSNGKHLYSSDYDNVILWNAETGEKRKVWTMPSHNGCFVLSRDDKFLAIGNKDGTISIYRTSDLK